ncbi:hypothetical protein EWB00_009338 [Schistosoma japonicum]|uniref:CID domain-containing protein n=1 Tax=Schistosoma japonicum TaxID=6182 RepID=A0A4Z2CM67_SCHJA|nr:hypothetical protein EWB00_009338 [Schistosoma japonicum]
MISSSLIVNLEEVNEFERNLKTANNNTQQLINKLFEISMQRINSAKEAVDTFERNLKTANNNTQQLINDQFNNVTQRIRSVKEAVSEFKGSLETTNENIRRLINDTFYIITQQIRSANGGVNVFERSLETIDENIRLLINNSRRAIEMLNYKKVIEQLIFNTSQSEKSNMTCNRPENISLHDLQYLDNLIWGEHHYTLSLDYFKLKKKALLLVWEDLDKAVNKR